VSSNHEDDKIEKTEIDPSLHPQNESPTMLHTVWKKVTGIFDKPPANLPVMPKIPGPRKEKQDLTMSENHTLHGKIQAKDLQSKGANFEETDVEIGEETIRNSIPIAEKDKIVFAQHQELSAKLNDHPDKTSIYTLDDTVQISLGKKPKATSKLVKNIVLVLLFFSAAGIYIQQNFFKEEQPVQTPIAVAPKVVPTEVPTELPTEAPSPEAITVGPGLIYQCEQNQWSCVDKKNFMICKTQQAEGGKCFVHGVFSEIAQCQKAATMYTEKGQDGCKP
jgi:hypothetical protein